MTPEVVLPVGVAEYRAQHADYVVMTLPGDKAERLMQCETTLREIVRKWDRYQPSGTDTLAAAELVRLIARARALTEDRHEPSQ